jgi:hypothetical protein
MNKRCILILFLTLALSADGFAQSRWIGNLPMQYNPSFAGSTGGHRISSMGSSQYYKQHENDSNFFKRNDWESGLSYDVFISRIASGLGFILSYNTMDHKSYHFSTDSSGLDGTRIIFSNRILRPQLCSPPKSALQENIHWLHPFSSTIIITIN